MDQLPKLKLLGEG